MKFLRFIAIGVLASITGCSGGASSTALTSLTPNVVGVPLIQQGMPAPFNPRTDSLLSLEHTTLSNVSSSDVSLISTRLRRREQTRFTESTIEPGDPGFYVGLGIKDAVTAVYAILTAYTVSEAPIPYPPSGKTIPPVRPERFFGPEIDPGASCLAAGLVLVNFGPGGTQRNGPGNPIQTLTGAYNAFRVLDFCNPTPNQQGQPQPVTFFLTPLDAKFTDFYVRPNESGLPSIVTEVFSENDNAFTNAHATWYAIIYNFKTNRWNVMNTSHGNVGGTGVEGYVMAYASPVNTPEVCPSIPPLIAQDIHVLDPASEKFVEPGAGKHGDLSHPVAAGVNDPAFSPATNSTACFTRDTSGPASFSFDFLPGKRWADWELKQGPAPEPAPQQ